MFKTLRSRLWIGYSILILLVLGAFFTGLLITLNQTSALYRQKELLMRLEEQTIMREIDRHPNNPLQIVTAYAAVRTTTNNSRLFLLNEQGGILFDSGAKDSASIQWKSVDTIQRTENFSNSLLTVDAEKNVWLYIGRRLEISKLFLVIATPRGNLSLKFMLSDPMILMIFEVLLFALALSLLITIIMNRWIANPIQKLSTSVKTTILKEHKALPIEGPLEVQELAESLNQMNLQVIETQQSQRDFISDVSHELKTPLTSIQGFANAILDGTVDDKDAIHHAATIILAESERMLRLVVDLLTLTRFEGGMDGLRKVPVELPELINGVIEKMVISANQAGVILENQIQRLPKITVDPDRITQVIMNLVDNAIKYSTQNTKVIISGFTDPQKIQIQVIDQGIGISNEDQKRIFNRFYQVEKSRSSGSKRSAGLGLPIARQIALAHGGDILVSSEIGSGTTFTLVLPIQIIK